MHLVFAAHAKNASLASACRRLMKTAEREGFACSILSDVDSFSPSEETVIIAVGGDGNFIRTAHIACEHNVPLFGVNCGRIGFLTEWTEESFPEALLRLRDGAYWIEQKSMLSVSVNDEYARDCVNDLLVYKHSFSGVASITLAINGQTVGDLFGDGITVATSTGATGYSLSAGGPIIADGLDAMVVTPICAHTLHFRPIVAAANASVTMTMADRGFLAADGDRFRSVQHNDRITVTRSDRTVPMMTFQTRNLFRLISEKLT